MVFGQRLRYLRESKKMTQKELAKALNSSESTIGMYERGEREPNFETVGKIASYFGVSVDFLLGHTNDSTQTQRIVQDYSPFLKAIKEKYPGVDIDDPEVQRKLMKAVDLVLEDYLEKQQKRQQ